MIKSLDTNVSAEVHVEKKQNQKPECVKESSMESEEDFYENMFYTYATDPCNKSCKRAYWTDGIDIVRTWDHKCKRWQYTTAEEY